MGAIEAPYFQLQVQMMIFLATPALGESEGHVQAVSS